MKKKRNGKGIVEDTDFSRIFHGFANLHFVVIEVYNLNPIPIFGETKNAFVSTELKSPL